MVNPCDCGTGGSNTGHPNCAPEGKVGSLHLIVQTVANDGTPNRINTATDTLDAPYWIGKFNEPDPSKRIFPLGEIENLVDLRDDPIIETFNSGRSRFIQEGSSKVSYLVPDFGETWLGKAQSFMCGNYSIYEVGADGSVKATKVVEGGVVFASPTPLQKDTFYPRLIKSTDTTDTSIQIQFEYDKSVNDADYIYILKKEMDNYNLLKAEGLLDLNIVTSLPTVTEVVVTVSTDYGTPYSPDYIDAFVVGDFSVNEITPAAAPVPISSAVLTPGTETTAPFYTLVYSAPQTIGDTQKVTITRTGFEITISDSYTTA